MTNDYIKPPVEIRYKNELDALKSVDIGKKPENWVLSPKAVRTFILGGLMETADLCWWVSQALLKLCSLSFSLLPAAA